MNKEMNKTTTFIIVITIILLAFFFSKSLSGNSISGGTIGIMDENTKVLLETNQGEIEIELYSQKMPITAGNFEKLVKEGFYDGVIFHRIINNFI